MQMNTVEAIHPMPGITRAAGLERYAVCASALVLGSPGSRIVGTRAPVTAPGPAVGAVRPRWRDAPHQGDSGDSASGGFR